MVDSVWCTKPKYFFLVLDRKVCTSCFRMLPVTSVDSQDSRVLAGVEMCFVTKGLVCTVEWLTVQMGDSCTVPTAPEPSSSLPLPNTLYALWRDARPKC